MTPSRSLVLCLVAALGCAPAALGVSEQRAPNYADATGKDWLYNHAIPEKREAQGFRPDALLPVINRAFHLTFPGS